MSVLDSEKIGLVARLHDLVDELQQLDLTPLADAELLDVWRQLERASRRLATIEHALITEIDARGIAEQHACRNTAALARGLLRITPGDARRRVEGAALSGPRRALTGAALTPQFPHVAAAQADGTVSPSHARITTTVLLTMDHHAWLTGAGWARTGHGARVPAREALRWATGDARALPIVLDDAGAVVGYADARRLFTESQRLALIARDGGCSFPACDAPPQYCEAHHIRDHARGGPTSIDNGTLLCRFHNDHFQACGWRCVLHDGRPAWIPPPWFSRDQMPLRNPLHDIEPSPARAADVRMVAVDPVSPN